MVRSSSLSDIQETTSVCCRPWGTCCTFGHALIRDMLHFWPRPYQGHVALLATPLSVMSQKVFPIKQNEVTCCDTRANCLNPQTDMWQQLFTCVVQNGCTILCPTFCHYQDWSYMLIAPSWIQRAEQQQQEARRPSFTYQTTALGGFGLKWREILFTWLRGKHLWQKVRSHENYSMKCGD